jgi:hypothetical protein
LSPKNLNFFTQKKTKKKGGETKMSRDLDNEIQNLTRDLQVGFEKANPSQQFRATIILAVISLHALVEMARNSKDQNERRRLINEFQRKKGTLEKWTQLLRQENRPRP